jgi:hypothetical protein
MAAADLIDLYEVKSFDGDTLRAIATVVFGVNVNTQPPPARHRLKS